jgi:hypothetical protein
VPAGGTVLARARTCGVVLSHFGGQIGDEGHRILGNYTRMLSWTASRFTKSSRAMVRTWHLHMLGQRADLAAGRRRAVLDQREPSSETQ